MSEVNNIDTKIEITSLLLLASYLELGMIFRVCYEFWYFHALLNVENDFYFGIRDSYKTLGVYSDAILCLCLGRSMVVVHFHCPFVGLSGCHDGGGNRLTKTSLNTHLRDSHCNGDAQVITIQSLTTNFAIFEMIGVTFKHRDYGDGIVRFVLYDMTKPQVPSSLVQLNHVEESIANAIRSWGMPGGSLQLVREALADPSPSWSNINEDNLDLGEQNVKQCKRKICDGHYTAAVKVLSSSGVAPYNDATLEDLKAKHPLKPAPSLPHIPIDHHQLIASPTVVLDMIKSFPYGTSCGWDGLRAQHLIDCFSGAAVAIFDELFASITQVVNLFLDGKCPKMFGKYIASAPLTLLVKPGGGIRPIVVGTIWRHLVSKVSAAMIGHSLDGYLNDLQFGVGVSGGGEAILHVVNRLIENQGDDVGLSMLLVDFKNAFNMVDREVMLQEVHLHCPSISRWWSFVTLAQLDCIMGNTPYGRTKAWYMEDGTIIGDTLVVGKLELQVRCSTLYFSEYIDRLRSNDLSYLFAAIYFGGVTLHLNVDKMEVFWPKEDPRSRLAGVFPPNISRPSHGVKLMGGPASVDFDFSSELVMKRVANSIKLMDDVAKINDPQCELLLLRSCVGVSKLYFAMCTCSHRVFQRIQRSFDAALQSSQERIETASGHGFGDWNGGLPHFPLHLGGLVSTMHMALWKSQMEDHTSDWLRVVPISGLGQSMNGRTYQCVLCYRLSVPLFNVPKPCSACSRVFVADIYGDHVVSCAGIIGIKHRHNIVRDTLVDICFWSAILAGKEVDIGLGGGRDKPLRPADMLLYSWDGGLDVCVDLTGLSSLTQTGMIDFAPGRAMIEAAQRKCVKYEAKCADIGYSFLPFSFSSFGELDKEAVTLLKRIRRFSVTQDITARAAVHIFNRIDFAIARGVGTQIVSRLFTNLL
ncbi:hypothetical protein Tco_0073088 [Tanacetum coccineum]